MIPEPRSEFVGRRVELETIAALLEPSRLVTLTGVGGVGKTRLAIRAANAHAQRHDEQAWFVPLETVVEPALLPLAMVRTLGLTDQSAREPLEVIVEALAEQDVLLVLDNCEHLIEAAAHTADRLLDALPRLRIVATSRRPLELVGEHVYAVPPLSLVDDGRASDALRLLDARARAAGAAGPATPLDELAASALVRALDGLPLAIELAATRLRTLPINDLVARVSSRFTLLQTGPRNAVERQRTLRAVVDWSYELCDQPQRELWAALSVFSSPFDLDGAVAMAGSPAEVVVDTLDQLVAQSVVEADHETGRFRMLETIRQYGRERAEESGRWPLIVRRHIDHVRETATGIRLSWWGPGQAEKLGRLRDDQAELEAALVALEAEDPDEALDLFSDLRYHWAVGGFLREGRAWAGRLLGASVPASPRRVPALITGAWLGLLQGDTAEAGGLLTAAESLVDAVDAAIPVDVKASALIEVPRWRGTRAMFLGDSERAQAYFTQSIEAAAHHGTPAESLLAQFQLTTARSHLRRADAAEPAAEALAHAELIGETWMRSHALWALALAAFVSGELIGAESYVRRALTVEEAFDDPVGMCLMLEVLCWTEARRGGDERAAVLLGAATTQWQRIGSAITVHGPQLTAHHDECMESLRTRLGSRSLAKLLGEGSRLGPREALALALRPLAEPAGGLSAREREVASGIHRGLSNREIAAELVLSVRTIDTHVQRIFTKLDVTSRAQVAAWFEASGT